MFSPIGRKRVLLEIKRDPQKKEELLKTIHSHSTHTLQATKEKEKEKGSPEKEEKLIRSRSSSPTLYRAISAGCTSTRNLEYILEEASVIGDVARKIMEVAIRYRKERDSACLTPFQQTALSYAEFRDHLKRSFRITFSEEEFDYVIKLFDNDGNGHVDGSEFLICFTKLASIHKAKVAKEHREKEKKFQEEKRLAQIRLKKEQEKKNALSIDYKYSTEVKETAISKVTEVAKKYDKNHPSAPSLDAFNGAFLTPLEFREVLRRTFHLQLTPGELGALIHEFDKNNDGMIECAEFLVTFFKLGFAARAQEKTEQLELQRQHLEAVKEEQAEKLKMAEAKMEIKVDYDFSEADEARMHSKLRQAAKKYDKSHQSALPPDGFEVKYMKPGVFREMVKRTFNLNLNSKELGACVKTFDKTGRGQIECHDFLVKFLQMGIDERNQERLEGLAKSRQLLKEAEEEKMQKYNTIVEKSTLKIESDFSEADKNRAVEKVREAAIKYDKNHPSALGLEGFDAEYLTPGAFKEMLKRTFNINLTIPELAALISVYRYQKSENANPAEFVKAFLKIGYEERAKMHHDALVAQREAEKKAKELEEKKLKEKELKYQMSMDNSFTEEDRESALRKMTETASKFSKNHTSSASLQGFEGAFLSPYLFKDLLYRSFRLKLKPKEFAALVKHFDTDGNGTINCSEFLHVFFKLGLDEREKWHRAQLETQRLATKQREEEQRKKLLESEQRFKANVDYNFTDKDLEDAVEKISDAAAKYDKNHPSAISLDGFMTATLSSGEFKEMVQRTFRINLSPRELAALLHYFEASKEGDINTSKFLTKFFHIGNERRNALRKESIEKQRALEKEAKKAHEKMLENQFKRFEATVRVDYEYTLADEQNAMLKLVEAAALYDKTNVSAPSLDGFTAIYIGPGEFRELLKRSFNIRLTEKELGALVKKFESHLCPNHVDCSMFVINFLQIGHSERHKMKVNALNLQKQHQRDREREEAQKLKSLEDKAEYKLPDSYGEVEKRSAIEKLTHAAFKYDKTMPGSVSLTAFDAQYLSAGQLREVLKRTFNLQFTPNEFAAIFKLYDTENQNRILSKNFMDEFIRIGVEERAKMRLIQIEKNRKLEKMHRQESIRRLKDAEAKIEVSVREEFTEAEQRSAFEKLRAAATKYDKNHPSSVSVTGFDALYLSYGQFRELVKRTFNIVLDEGELAALVTFFDKKKEKRIVSKEFLTYFTKVGVSERDRLHREMLKAQRDHKIEEERLHREKIEIQWNKMELNLSMEYDDKDKKSALKKFTKAAFKYDGSHPNAMSLEAFEVETLKPGVFREMLKRVLNVRLSDRELAALIDEFNDGNNCVYCPKFLVKFTQTGFIERDKRREFQRNKNKVAEEKARKELEDKIKANESKVESYVDWEFTHADFSSAIAKLKVVAATYDKNHPSAVKLDGFQGARLTPGVFREMLKRTFNVHLTPKELGAAVKFFDADGDGCIDNAEFLKHFFKLQRVERSNIRRNRIEAERNVLEKVKDEVHQRDQKKNKEESQLMQFTEEDEASMLTKLRDIAQKFAIDSSSFVGPMQSLKGPALPPNAFKEIFYRIFQVKLTYPEIGALFSVLDEAGSGVMDGRKFCNAFFRLGRLEEKLMFGEIQTQISLQSLRPSSAVLNSSSLFTSGSSTMKKSSQSSRDLHAAESTKSVGRSTSPEDLRNVSISAMESDIDVYSDVTIGKSWVLPATVKSSVDNKTETSNKPKKPTNKDTNVKANKTMDVFTGFTEESFDDFQPFIMVPRKPGTAPDSFMADLREWAMPNPGEPKPIVKEKKLVEILDKPVPLDLKKNSVKKKLAKTSLNNNFEGIKIRKVGSPERPSNGVDANQTAPASLISPSRVGTAETRLETSKSTTEKPTKVKQKSVPKKEGSFFFPTLLGAAPTINLGPVGNNIIEQENILLYQNTENF